MPSWTNYPVFFGPIVALLLLGGLILLLRWAFSRGKSVVSRPVVQASSTEYGLMRSVGRFSTDHDAQETASHLTAANVRANVVRTADGIHVMVLRDDLPAAQLALGMPPSPGPAQQ